MQGILPYLISGISVGGQYALIAIGYTLVYGILRLINFAHGDVFMVAGLIMVYTTASMPMYISIPLVLIFTVILGFAIERVAYKPLRTAPRMSLMISAIGVSYLIQNLAFYLTGGLPQPVNDAHSVDLRHRDDLRRVHQARHGRDASSDRRARFRARRADQKDEDRHGYARGRQGL